MQLIRPDSVSRPTTATASKLIKDADSKEKLMINWPGRKLRPMPDLVEIATKERKLTDVLKIRHIEKHVSRPANVPSVMIEDRKLTDVPESINEMLI